MEESSKECRQCYKHKAIQYEMYCTKCKRELIARLERMGYLTPKPYVGKFRGQDAREDRHETKYGIDC